MSRSELPRSESNGASHQVLEELRIAAVTASQTRSARAADLASCLLSHDRGGRTTLEHMYRMHIANCVYLLQKLTFCSSLLFLFLPILFSCSQTHYSASFLSPSLDLDAIQCSIQVKSRGDESHVRKCLWGVLSKLAFFHLLLRRDGSLTPSPSPPREISSE